MQARPDILVLNEQPSAMQHPTLISFAGRVEEDTELVCAELEGTKKNYAVHVVDESTAVWIIWQQDNENYSTFPLTAGSVAADWFRRTPSLACVVSSLLVSTTVRSYATTCTTTAAGVARRLEIAHVALAVVGDNLRY